MASSASASHSGNRPFSPYGETPYQAQDHEQRPSDSLFPAFDNEEGYDSANESSSASQQEGFERDLFRQANTTLSQALEEQRRKPDFHQSEGERDFFQRANTTFSNVLEEQRRSPNLHQSIYDVLQQVRRHNEDLKTDMPIDGSGSEEGTQLNLLFPDDDDIDDFHRLAAEQGKKEVPEDHDPANGKNIPKEVQQDQNDVSSGLDHTDDDKIERNQKGSYDTDTEENVDNEEVIGSDSPKNEELDPDQTVVEMEESPESDETISEVNTSRSYSWLPYVTGTAIAVLVVGLGVMAMEEPEVVANPSLTDYAWHYGWGTPLPTEPTIFERLTSSFI